MSHRPEGLLITGGAGFIGSALIRFLLRAPDFDGRIVNLDALTYAGNPDNLAPVAQDPRYTFVHGDIGDEALVSELCARHRIDTIVNLAAESHVDRSIHGPRPFVETNVVGTLTLLEVARARANVHFHQVSTDEVYGSLGETGLFTEESPYDPRSPYAASKAAADHLVRAYANTYGLSTTISNCSNNYGRCQFPEKLIPLMLLKTMAGEPLPVYGDGGNVRDWIFVDDHAEALWVILTHGEAGESYNVSAEEELTNLELLSRLLDVIADRTGRDRAKLEAQITFVEDRPGHDRRYALDARKLRTELGWAPRHPLAEGLEHTVDWYLANPAWIANVKSGAYREWLAKNYDER